MRGDCGNGVRAVPMYLVFDVFHAVFAVVVFFKLELRRVDEGREGGRGSGGGRGLARRFGYGRLRRSPVVPRLE